MTDQDKITALRDALQNMLEVYGEEYDRTCVVQAHEALAMTADASEGATDSAPKFDEAEFDAMVERGTAAWKDVPDDWLERARGNAPDSPADARAKEAYDYRHLTQVAQGMGFEDIAGALTELVRIRGADGEGI